MAAVFLFVVALSGARVPAASAAAAGVTADFSRSDGVGHAEVFGSSINVPMLTDPDKIETLHQSGTRFVRGDAYLGEILPDTTIDAYLASMASGTGVADPATWNWGHYGWVDEHHKRGAKVMLILSYSTNWLGYQPGPYFWNGSPPRGADGFKVYRDAVAKIYQHFRGKVDLVEVWNEPDNQFIDLTGSPYGTGQRGKLAAYKDIYYNAATAVRSVDPVIPIGGPALSQPTPVLSDPNVPGDVANWPQELLGDPRIAGLTDFLSYHTYNDFAVSRAEAVTTWKQAARAAGKGDDFPVYVTEWNYDWNYNRNPMNAPHPYTISYTATRLTEFLKQHANGTNFFADNDESLLPDFFGVHGNGMLPPKARTYHLLSVDLGLGAGESTLRPVSFPPSISNAGAATTATGDRVAWVVNDSAAAQEIDLNLTGLGATGPTTANIFEAGPAQSPLRPKASVPLTGSGGAATVRITVPVRGVVGVRLTPAPVADSENLAPGAKITPSSVYSGQFDGGLVADGVIRRHEAGEWASRGELTPNVKLEWPTPKAVGQVVLYDRPNFEDHVLAGRLDFGDGTSVPVPELPNDGIGKTVSFPVREVTGLTFVVTRSTGKNLGLSELQVFAGANVVKDGTVTTSSEADLGQHSRLKAVDGVTTAAGEWVSTETNPWIRVGWVNRHQVDRVVLYDRPGGADANSGTLTFSDGTAVAVTGIPADGTPKPVIFPARPVSWVKFQVTGGSGGDVGLAELRVLGAGNIASSAQVTASSAFADADLQPAAATDGVLNQWYVGEWASGGERNPWLQLTWDAPQTIGQVVLYDRDNPDDSVLGGTLAFSDGSTMPVPALDNSGTGEVIAFPPRSVTWVRFSATGAATSRNVGLSEVEAYRPG
ncbi:DUF7402 domain-containing protein [Amycolatopsis sp. NPDC005003]